MEAEELASKAESVSEMLGVSGSRWRTDWRRPSAGTSVWAWVCAWRFEWVNCAGCVVLLGGCGADVAWDECSADVPWGGCGGFEGAGAVSSGPPWSAGTAVDIISRTSLIARSHLEYREIDL